MCSSYMCIHTSTYIHICVARLIVLSFRPGFVGVLCLIDGRSFVQLFVASESTRIDLMRNAWMYSRFDGQLADTLVPLIAYGHKYKFFKPCMIELQLSRRNVHSSERSNSLC